MPTFTWKGRLRGKEMQEGVMNADNKEAVINLLRRQQIIVTAVTERGKEFALPIARYRACSVLVERGWLGSDIRGAE